jgi:hypothetical protein
MVEGNRQESLAEDVMASCGIRARLLRIVENCVLLGTL